MLVSVDTNDSTLCCFSAGGSSIGDSSLVFFSFENLKVHRKKMSASNHPLSIITQLVYAGITSSSLIAIAEDNWKKKKSDSSTDGEASAQIR
ncbi:uncharacterized protein M6B38_154655 [Iris pallida]|uniref:Uncharacterized protein n=1 Tax=Iris pallida TaxID=29817 RepID=A0AAX6F5M0_IRIPA|nr:uncharacterized protein M6B38_154655 [Iris pallida]